MNWPAEIVLIVAGALSVALLAYVIAMMPHKAETQFRQSLRMFSKAIELRFPSLDGISASVVAYSLDVGKQLGLNERRLEHLEMAAQLRDIGLCSVPYRQINDKPLDAWSGEEMEAFERHAEVSAAMLDLVPSLRHLAKTVRCHHAAWDGSAGYLTPSRSQLPIEARILNVVSSYFWLERVDGPEVAIAKLEADRGHLFDPKVVAVFLPMLRSGGERTPARARAKLA